MIPTLANDNTSPELDTKKVLRLIQIGFSKRSTYDHINSREDDVVEWS